jgi:hypothetical protein
MTAQIKMGVSDAPHQTTVQISAHTIKTGISDAIETKSLSNLRTDNQTDVSDAIQTNHNLISAKTAVH